MPLEHDYWSKKKGKSSFTYNSSKIVYLIHARLSNATWEDFEELGEPRPPVFFFLSAINPLHCRLFKSKSTHGKIHYLKYYKRMNNHKIISEICTEQKFWELIIAFHSPFAQTKKSCIS